MSLSFPKIWHLGVPQAARLCIGPIEITEKLDGSQFNFGVLDDGTLKMRSKGADVLEDTQDKLFGPVARYISSIRGHLFSDFAGWWFHGETLCKPKHSTLAYERVPLNNFALFAARQPNGVYISDHGELSGIADKIGVDVVRLIFQGDKEKIDLSDLEAMLKLTSQLGGCNIEGVVIKNYAESIFMGGMLLPILCAKYVSEAFKEKHAEGWTSYSDKLQAQMQSYRTEARWRKAVQHLREKGELKLAPQDIGNLLKELNVDSAAEIKEEFLDFCWKYYWKDLAKIIGRGFPEWYKQQLVEGTFADGSDQATTGTGTSGEANPGETNSETHSS